MVDVTMRQEDLLDGHARLRCGGLEAWKVPAGIDEGTEHGRSAP
jgi:hypothetical protein